MITFSIETNENTINKALEHTREMFNFSEKDMQSVPQNPFTYLTETFKAFRTSQVFQVDVTAKFQQARVAQLVARWLAVPEIRVQTPPGAN